MKSNLDNYLRETPTETDPEGQPENRSENKKNELEENLNSENNINEKKLKSNYNSEYFMDKSDLDFLKRIRKDHKENKLSNIDYMIKVNDDKESYVFSTRQVKNCITWQDPLKETFDIKISLIDNEIIWLTFKSKEDRDKRFDYILKELPVKIKEIDKEFDNEYNK